ncbi:SAM-dependent methyltransferase [Tardiphaga sp. vice352]|uniref:small ribosomal subunit Rsm22 family protein n=1 Tax=unclassified Tardiphaga TaxID=2631404 RepID=UPI001165306E|nr:MULTISPECIES: small ribosomal subunit Rsm22 family protein [unclassified Tardiphaga]QDM18727.1 SAM-dependent methyltransferase [Tardiphaga sp. vice278]QDM23723.1 SAM-dependent methyltransferase [Tardiphaga sp. vice154]QDM28946.1 SAM-dependent methyltransferase [Tardiphaga sp. vice304]QDM34045.1 SAM-dependent methyltransferase [Tardiphaga sp. vice352]
MTAPELPAELTAALNARLHGLSRNDAALRSDTISQTYRSGGGSIAIRSEADALAYALARMPATYAAVTASLNALQEVRPDFPPRSLLDCGAGPGTASWACAEAFASLNEFTLLDANPALRSLALDLTRDSMRLPALRYELGDATATIAKAPAADLVIASYVINELPDAARQKLVAAMWAKTLDTLLIVEPGTPAGYQRILDARAMLIADGGHVLAPCPHDDACPLTAPDWCHFSQRLQRSRVHKQLKSAELPYEDERFIYLALSRSPATRRPSRVLAQPVVSKVAVTAKLCTPDGVVAAVAPRRDKAAYARARKWGWGDAVD